MKRVFLSYSSKDREFVNRLAMDIRARGFDVWYDQWQLEIGDSLLNKIQEGIKQSSWLVVVLSPHANESKWVTEELNSGLANQLAEDHIYVLPVLYKDCEIPPFLRDKVYADFRQDYLYGLQRLILTLRRQYLARAREGLLQNIIEKSRKLLASNHSLYNFEDSSGARYKDSYIKYSAYPRRSFKEARKSMDMLIGLWVGPTGRLRLSMENDQITGEYDWQGDEYSGKLKGTLEAGAFVFEWSWDITSESGGGLFYQPIPNRLIGGWWMKYDYINPHDLLKAHELPLNHWEFTRSHDS
jgi:hypothetical protein